MRGHRINSQKRKYQLLFILFFVLVRSTPTIRFEGLDLCPDFGFTLFEIEARCNIFLAFDLPVLRLFGRLKSGILTNGCIRIGVDFFDVL
jgi:hypothetical protein